MRDIPTLINTHAVDAGHLFTYGDLEYQNYETQVGDLTDGDYVLMLLPVINKAAEIANGSTVDKWDAEIRIYFGRKFDETSESGTYSSINETFLQKHTRRLQACREAFVTFIEGLVCSTDLELMNLSMNDAVNIFSVSMDAIIINLVLRHDHETYPDIVIPLLSSAEIGDVANDIIILTYAELLDGDSVPSVGDFVLSGTDSVILSIAISLMTVRLTLDQDVIAGETLLLDYTKGSSPIQDRAENEAEDFTEQVVVNNLPIDDWFLPSGDESKAMYNNLHSEGVGNFTSNDYWSSTELASTFGLAVKFTNGATNGTFKSTSNYVRACRTFTAAEGDYSLRDIGQAGGLIFYIDGTTHYEAAPSDQSTSKVWSNITDTLIGTINEAIGTGQANTDAIIEQEGHTDSAAKLCDDLIITP